MEILSYLFLAVSFLLVFFLVFPSLTIFLSFFTREKLQLPSQQKQYDFACIITAYQNAGIAQGLVQSLLKQRYERFHIYLVADACDVSKWNFQHEKLTLLRPGEPLNLKVKSIIHAVENFHRNHEFIVVFDADNLAHPDFLTEINRYANAGHTCIQGQRTAKNLDTVYACADATGEFYKNYIDRLVPYLLGSSSVISGSGMAVETNLYQAYLQSPEIEQGKQMWKKMLQEDKILQNFILRQNDRITYAWNAIVFDEKVTTASAVETQRSRWLFSYFQNIPNVLGIFRRGIFNLSFNQIFFSIVTIVPPMFIMLFGAMVMAVLALFIAPWMSALLVAAIVVFSLNILLTLYLSKVPEQIWKALWGMPLFVWNQAKALTKMTNPNKNFKHTEHTRSITIDQVMK
jgi:cellulose synthase/poly-beta-1,6-N-acetylglucosamine synthase-like glycosyltransferase